MFFDGSFFFLRNSVDLYLKNIPAKKKNAIQLAVWEEKIFKGFLLWLPWLPELFMEHNYLKEFERGPPKEQRRKTLKFYFSETRRRRALIFS